MTVYQNLCRCPPASLFRLDKNTPSIGYREVQSGKHFVSRGLEREVLLNYFYSAPLSTSRINNVDLTIINEPQRPVNVVWRRCGVCRAWITDISPLLGRELINQMLLCRSPARLWSFLLFVWVVRWLYSNGNAQNSSGTRYSTSYLRL